jgi:hypothetical protein
MREKNVSAWDSTQFAQEKKVSVHCEPYRITARPRRSPFWVKENWRTSEVADSVRNFFEVFF